MYKRVISFILATIMLLAITPAYASESNMKLSDDGIAYLKREEGFSKMPYWDYGQWTVGYGCACPKDKLEEYKENGIPEEEAEALLRSHVEGFESYVNRFIKTQSLTLTQSQFDMLVCFSYNVGPMWMFTTSSPLRQAIIDGSNNSSFVRELALWSKAGGDVLNALVERRIRDANMYLSGDYTTKNPAAIGYVYYAPNGGQVVNTVQGFIASEQPTPAEIPTWEGHTFMGWYTKQAGGDKVKVLTRVHFGMTLYAHWDTPEGEASQTTESFKVRVTGTDVNLREGPGTNHKRIGRANKGDILTVSQTSEGSGYTWGKTEKGWICMKYVSRDLNAPTTTPSAPNTPSTPEQGGKPGVVKVEGALRIRKGPGLSHSTVGYLSDGDKVNVYETATSDNMTWGRIGKDKWVSMNYVKLDKENDTDKPDDSKPSGGNQEVPTSVSMHGVVNVDTSLTIRKTPGMRGTVLDYYHCGDEVYITELKYVDAMTWGKTEDGWISMEYVDLKIKGEVNADKLRIRKDAGTSYPVVGYVYEGDEVVIDSVKLVNDVQWGRTEDGWLCMNYIKR